MIMLQIFDKCRPHLLAIVMSIFSLLPTAGMAKDSPVSLYSRWQSMPMDSLMDMGRRFNIHNSSDSALVCFSVVADRLRHHASTRQEQQVLSRALTNMGYIYASFFYDYTRALELFQESLKTGNLCDYREDAAYIHLNIGGIYLSCNNLYGNNIFSSECWDYLGKAFIEGLELRQFEVALVALLNMGQLFFEDRNPENIKRAIDLLANYKRDIPSDTSFLSFTLRYSDGLREYIEGNYDSAIQIFSEATALTQSGSMHAARLELIALTAMAEA